MISRHSPLPHRETASSSGRFLRGLETLTAREIGNRYTTPSRSSRYHYRPPPYTTTTTTTTTSTTATTAAAAAATRRIVTIIFTSSSSLFLSHRLHSRFLLVIRIDFYLHAAISRAPVLPNAAELEAAVRFAPRDTSTERGTYPPLRSHGGDQGWVSRSGVGTAASRFSDGATLRAIGHSPGLSRL